MLTAIYVIVSWLVGCKGYAMAREQGRFDLRWGWLCFLFIFPLGLLWRDRHLTPDGAAGPDRRWQRLIAKDREVRNATERLRPLGETAVARLAADYRAAKDRTMLSSLVHDIEGRWSAYRDRGLSVVETQRGAPILRDASGMYQVDEQVTKDLRTARVLAHRSRTAG